MKSRFSAVVLAWLAGCGAPASTAPAGTTPARAASQESPGPASEQDGVRPVSGEACVAAYLADHDVTLITTQLPTGGFAVAPALGDGWRIDCRPRGNQLMLANRGNENVSIVVDGMAEVPTDLASYAREHGAPMQRSIEANGVRAAVGQPLVVSGRVYALVTNGVLEGAAFAQISVYSLVSSPVGVIRYHGSIIGPNAEEIAARSYEYAQVAERFAYVSPEQARALQQR